ncbi:MAG: hypothetical protein ACFFG0_22820 [Candidatus Thorarchaeota archaeon]
MTHIKWIISKYAKALAGLSTQSRKPVLGKWRWLLKRFYNLIDSKDGKNAYIKLEIMCNTIECLNGKKVKEMYSALKQLESRFPKIIAHQRNPFMASTNNPLEGFHKKYTY